MFGKSSIVDGALHEFGCWADGFELAAEAGAVMAKLVGMWVDEHADRGIPDRALSDGGNEDAGGSEGICVRLWKD